MHSELWKYPIHWLAYGFGTGLSPFAPGTVGTILAVPLLGVITRLPHRFYGLLVIALYIPGIFICGQTARDVGAIDPGFIVYDEIVGFFVAMYRVPFHWRWVLAGFAVYRLFDIWKPFPVGWIEDQLGLGSGIMTDDVIAGLYTLLVLHSAIALTRRI